MNDSKPNIDTTDPVFRDWLRGILTVENVTVTFTKTDGTEREMRCTLNPVIAIPYEKKTEKLKKTNTDALAVWDLDKNEWRSFRYSSIKSINFTLGKVE